MLNLNQLKAEWPVIKGAPWSFAIVILVVSGFIWGGFRWFYTDRISETQDSEKHWKGEADYWKAQAARQTQPLIPSQVEAKPLPPKIITQYLPAPTDGIHVTNIKKFPNEDPSAPFGLEVTVETDKEIQPVGLWIQCDVEMDKGSYAKLPVGRTYTGANTPSRVDLHWDTLGIKWQSPAWKPHEPIVAHIVSANPIELKRVIRNMPRWN
jgi:hypothetical protein